MYHRFCLLNLLNSCFLYSNFCSLYFRSCFLFIFYTFMSNCLMYYFFMFFCFLSNDCVLCFIAYGEKIGVLFSMTEENLRLFCSNVREILCNWAATTAFNWADYDIVAFNETWGIKEFENNITVFTV